MEQRIRFDDELAERLSVARRTLRALPDEMLAALARGLRRHAEDLVPGRLYGAAGGGCAVGVMLRELDPEAYAGSGMRIALLHGWRRRTRSYGGELGRNPRLRHLEWTFDASVERLRRLRPGTPRREAARLAGGLLLREAERELALRRLGREIESSELVPLGSAA